MQEMPKRKRWLGKITKRFWVSPKKYLDILANEAEARKSKQLEKRVVHDYEITPKQVAKYVAKAAERILSFNPSALVAVDKRGILATRLVQHYIKRKTGKTHRVYIVKPAPRKGLVGRTESAELLNPEQESKLKKEKRLAVIDDVDFTGQTLRSVNTLLQKKTLLRQEIAPFPLMTTVLDKIPLLYPSVIALSPTYGKEDMKKGIDKWITESTRHERFADYTIFRDALDDYMNKKKIGKDTRVKN